MRRFFGLISVAVWCSALAGFGLPAAASAAGSVYVANYGSDTISQYTINTSSGALSPKNPGTVSAGPNPVRITVSPDGKSAYVASFNGAVSQYTIDHRTGALLSKTRATVSAGVSPEDVVVTPDGKNA